MLFQAKSNEYMQTHLNPIEKHKMEIEKRINLLEQKFKQQEKPRDNQKRLRELIQDQNRSTLNQTVGSKTVEVRGKIRNQLEVSKVAKQQIFHSKQLLQQPLTQTTFLRSKHQQNPPQQRKDEKINELYDMMRSILQGQKKIEKELNQLKSEKSKDSGKNVKNYEQEQIYVRNAQKLNAYQQTLNKKSKLQQKPDQKNNKQQASKNQSFLFQQVEQPAKVRQQKVKKQRMKKNCNFEELLGQLRGNDRNGERICVEEEWKSRIWSQVENRVKQSEKQYKDTIHRNNKHQFQHLMSTFELQRKLKDELIDKIYFQCNNQLYK